MKSYDVIIVGAGIVGLVLACQLAPTQLKIAIIESKPPPAPIPDYDPRVFAITRASQHIFQQLGVWSAISEQRISPYRQMEVWDGSGQGHIQFDCRDVGEPNLGHIIENNIIQTALLAKAQTFTSIDFHFELELADHQTTDNYHILTSKAGDKLQTPLVIGADGANSWLRQQAAIDIHTWAYGHDGLIATVTTEKAHQKVARQCFMPVGPLAFLPLADPYMSSIVWSIHSEQAAELTQMEMGAFKHRLANAFQHRLGDIKAVSQRIRFPLHMRHAKTYVKPGLALVGDAAHTIHPLAGQGVNLGILDAHTLADVIMAARAKQRDYASLATLRKYERQRKGHNVAMIAAMEGFKQLFSSQHPLVHWARNIGLNITDHLLPLKHQLMQQALGAKTTEFG